ncbi:MAG TPA: alpha-hydroxy acid oxidase [Candidatus Angelobacter sp.]|nr:alpha-hydroxy acid oxidase [Candidatus Angelobacter sp.]
MSTPKIFCLPDLEALSESCMSPMARAYLCGGAGDEITMRANCEDWKLLRLNPRILVDVSEIDTRTELLGQSLDLPILLAPAAFQRLWHQEGELATVEGANRAGVTLVTSTYATVGAADLARAATRPLWFQLYTQPDRGMTQELVKLAEAAGCKAIAVTVDTPVLGIRNREARSEFNPGTDVKLPNIAAFLSSGAPVKGFSLTNPKLTWSDIEWLCSVAKIPVWLKGVMNPDDAVRAATTGAAGVIVSNHGARNLDTQPSTAAALPRIAEKIQGKIPLLVDGGIRRGSDIVKALALGAKAVLIGRPYLHGLAIAGAEGVARVVEVLREELKAVMALTGRRSIAEIDRSVLWEG